MLIECAVERERREREYLSKHLYIVGNTYIRYMPTLDYVVTVRIPRDMTWVVEDAKKLAQLERVSFSEIFRRALEEYVKKHEGGNPQKPMFPSQEPWVIPMVERRRENLVWLEDVIRNNPGCKWLQAVAMFSSKTGLRRETVAEYLKTLKAAGIVREIRGYLYTNDKLPS